MTRHILPALRQRLRKRRAASRSTTRHLRLEHLDRRIVLSGLPEATAMLDTPSEPAATEAAAVTDTQAAQLESATVAPVYLAEDGVLHVQPAAADANVVVRQFIDYQLQEVIEVEVAGQWTAVSVEQVQELHIHLASAEQTVEVTDEVAVPVQLVEPEAVDAVLASEDPELLVTLPLVDPLDTTTNAGPEDEEQTSQDPPGSSNLQPEIVNFTATEQDGFWEFTGTVTDDDLVVNGTVLFGGVLAGQATTINADGTFSFTIALELDDIAYATAVYTDADGWQSELAMCDLL